VNKTQISYFCDKVDAALRQVKRLPVDDESFELSNEERIGQLLRGEARFKSERFGGGSCPSYADHMFKFFEFKGEDELNAKRQVAARNLAKTQKAAERAAEKLKDDFVLERVKEPTEAIEKFLEKFTGGAK